MASKKPAGAVGAVGLGSFASRAGQPATRLARAESIPLSILRSRPVRNVFFAERIPFRARGVAQPGSALRSGRRGPQFKSGHPDQGGGKRCFPRRPLSFVPSTRADATGLPAGKAGLRPVRGAVRVSREEPPGVWLSPAPPYSPGLSRFGAPRSSLRRRFHALRPGPELGPRGIAASASVTGSRSTRLVTRKHAPLPSRRCKPKGGLRAQRRDLDRVHGEDRPWHGWRPGRRAGSARPTWCASGSGTELLALRGRPRRPRRARRHGMKLGLVTNGQRDLEEFVAHRGLEVDAMVGSRLDGRTKPHPSIFVAALRVLEVEPGEAAMVGDSYADDIAGARALGMRAILLDRDGLRPDEPERIEALLALPAALGLTVSWGDARVALPAEGEASLAPTRRARGATTPCARPGRCARPAGSCRRSRRLRRASDGASRTSSSPKCSSHFESGSWRRFPRSPAQAQPDLGPYCRSTSSGRPTSSHRRAKNFGSRAATVRWRPSCVASPGNRRASRSASARNGSPPRR